jgi:hypothetical protein
MPIFKFEGPDGTMHKVEGPEGSTPEQAFAALQSRISSEPAEPAREKTSNTSAFLQGTGQGITGGLSDEGEGVVRGAIDYFTGAEPSFTDAYAKRRDASRERLSQAAEDHPVAYYGGELAGGVALPMGAARVGVRGAMAAASGKGLAARSVAGAKEGAVYGGLYGYGTGQGGLDEQVGNTLKGAAFGGAVGGAAPAVIDQAAAVGGRIMEPIRNHLMPQQVAAEKGAEALARDMGTGSATPRDIVMAQERLAARAKMLEGDPTAIVADLGDEATRRLVRQASNMTNDKTKPFNKMLDQRQRFQPARLERALLGDGQEFHATTKELVGNRAANAKPAFDDAYSMEWNVTPDDELGKLLNRGYMTKLVNKTQENIKGMTGGDAPELAAVVNGAGQKSDDLLKSAGPKFTARDTADARDIKDLVSRYVPDGLDDANAEAIFSNYQYVKSMKGQKGPTGLADWIIQRGGIQDQGGELTHMLGRVKDRPGLVSKKGATLDDMAHRAWEDGHLPQFSQRPTPREFLEALDDDINRGSRQYHGADAGVAEDLAAARELATELERMGITSKTPEHVVKEALGIKDDVAASLTPKAPAAPSGGGLRPWEQLHRVLMRVNDEIGALKRGGSSSETWTLRDLMQMKNEIRTAIRDKNPKLAHAVDNFAEESRLVDALKNGREGFKKLSPEEIGEELAGLSRDEQALYRAGGARTLIEKVRKGNTDRDRTARDFSSPEVQMQLKHLFPDQRARREFQHLLVREARKTDLRNAVQTGSKTDQNLINAQEAGKGMSALKMARIVGGTVLTGGANLPVEAALYFGRGNNKFSGLNPKSANALLTMMSRPASEGMDPLVFNALNRGLEAPGRRAQIASRAAVGVQAGASSAPERERRRR